MFSSSAKVLIWVSARTTPATLDKQVKRMLDDPRAKKALVESFASQWLNLRQVVDVVIDPNKYPLYDESLLRGFQAETEMFVASTIEEDAPLRQLLDAGVPGYSILVLLPDRSGRDQYQDRLAGLDLGPFGAVEIETYYSQAGRLVRLFWPLVAGRLASCAVMAALALSARRPLVPPVTPAGLLALVGILDVGGNLCFLLATQRGRLDVAVVLGSLYPIVTVVMAWWFLHERLKLVQYFGIAFALLGVVLISAVSPAHRVRVAPASPGIFFDSATGYGASMTVCPVRPASGAICWMSLSGVGRRTIQRPRLMRRSHCPPAPIASRQRASPRRRWRSTA